MYRGRPSPANAGAGPAWPVPAILKCPRNDVRLPVIFILPSACLSMLSRAIALTLLGILLTPTSWSQSGHLFTTPPRLPKDMAGVRIRLSRTVCFGTCPDYSITIFGDGSVVYEGRQLVKTKGKQYGRVPIDTVRNLADQFVSSGYFTFQGFYGNCGGGDAPMVVTTLTWAESSKTVKHCLDQNLLGRVPSGLIELEAAVDIAAKSHQWVGTDKERINY